jgi:hypothetical protein
MPSSYSLDACVLAGQAGLSRNIPYTIKKPGLQKVFSLRQPGYLLSEDPWLSDPTSQRAWLYRK